MTEHEIAKYWLWSMFGALTVVCAKLGYLLFALGEQPPEDAAGAVHWRRKRRWLAISEFAALPMFATIAVASTSYFNLPVVASVLIAMALGGLGFGFLLHGLQYIARRRLEKVQ